MGALTNQAHLFYSTYIFVCLMYPNAASEHGRVRLSLRGGQDPQLIAEALSDLKRMRRGKLPLFLEKVMDGYDDDRTCSDANFEAKPPPTFGLSTASSMQRVEQMQDLDPELTQEEEDRLDRERAKKYFQELDAKYFYPHENVVGHQRVNLPCQTLIFWHPRAICIPQKSPRDDLSPRIHWSDIRNAGGSLNRSDNTSR